MLPQLIVLVRLLHGLDGRVVDLTQLLKGRCRGKQPQNNTKTPEEAGGFGEDTGKCRGENATAPNANLLHIRSEHVLMNYSNVIYGS